MAYPSAEHASFLIDYPAGWEMTAGEEVGDYVTLRAPAGATLMFRTIPGDEAAMNAAVEDSYQYIQQTYSDVELGEPEDSEQAGLTGFYATGSGADDEGTPMVFGMAWYALEDGQIGEIWFVTAADDKAGAAAASKVLDSFRAP